MTEADVLNIGRDALMTGLIILGPIVITALVVGLAIAVFQAVTQVNEPTMTFVPKIIGVAIVVILLGPLMLNRLVTFTRQSFEQISAVLR